MAVNSRTTPTRTVASTPRRAAAPKDYEEASAAEAQEVEAAGHYVTAELCGVQLELVPASAWRHSTMRKLRQGFFDEFMEDVLSPESFDVYVEVDPTNDEFNDFMDRVNAIGEPVGKSNGPRPSQRSTRRR